MKRISIDREKNIYEIISVVKLASLLFCGIILFQNAFSGKDYTYYLSVQFFSRISLIVATCTLAMVYILWAFTFKGYQISRNKRYIKYIENSIFISIFFFLIISSGANTSEYKFLFLFIIITSTIQYGMKHGVGVSLISSMLILGLDLVYTSDKVVNKYFENDLILCGVFVLSAWVLGYYVRVENEHRSKLAHLANMDGLTEVYNHRFFYGKLGEEIDICKKEDSSISVLLVDIDYFKHYNDVYGHQKGDEVLRKIGYILKDSLGDNGIAARYGGEEFAVILPKTSEQEAIFTAEAIRSNIEKAEFDGEEHQPNGKITVSVGVSTLPDKAKTLEELIKAADDALYRAKFFNKNRVETYYSILEELKDEIDEEQIDLISSVKTLISVINAKDRYTYGHSERVVLYSKLLGDRLGLSEKDKKILKYGAYMHDIGKINIEKDILNKRMPLTNEEWGILKEHPANGIKIVKTVKSLEEVVPLILYHHERYDGNGYPTKRKGKDIPYLARILTVVDSFDAMTSNRPYNTRKTYDEAVLELKKCSGTQFDPKIVEVFAEVIINNKDQLDNLANSNQYKL
jgi:diguanylate cyclase (GGDEF)-like protein